MDNKGFTLIELLFTIGFVLIFSTAIGIIGFTGYVVYKYGSACNWDIAKCVGRVAQEIKQ